MAMQEILLLNDVDHLGRKGEIVKVKAGYAWNFLLPRKFAKIADKRTKQLQEQLRQEREKQAEIDKVESLELAARLKGVEISIQVKVDPEGHMYGSVNVADILHLLEQQGIRLEKKAVLLKHPIKTVGHHDIALKLKEEIEASVRLTVCIEESTHS